MMKTCKHSGGVTPVFAVCHEVSNGMNGNTHLSVTVRNVFITGTEIVYKFRSFDYKMVLLYIASLLRASKFTFIGLTQGVILH